MTALRAIFRIFPVEVWIGLGVAAILAAGFGAYKWQEARANRAEAQLAPAVASTKALDKVATETPIIRQEQQEKQREVDQIQGADQPLPGGFGADLERVRRGRTGPDSR